MRGPAGKNVVVVALALLLAGIGVYNIVLKATWTMLDDGVFWAVAPEGLVASRVAPGGPGSLGGVKTGDILLALDGAEVLTTEELEARLAERSAGRVVQYSILRVD